uniref:DUF1279 domain-containing protein n=2 Tax=Arion vulgaris TaxID=1028688 RepID=A0A0B7BD78_9EUPU
MNLSRISRFGLSKLVLKQHGLLCDPPILSTRNQHILSWNYYFVTESGHRRHFSQLYRRQNIINSSGSYISTSNLVARDSLSFYPKSCCPLNVAQYRGLRGFPSNRTDKYSLEKVANKTTDILGIDKLGRKNIVLTGTVRENLNADKKTVEQATVAGTNDSDSLKKLTLYQRFKKTYKEHGKVLVGVHLITSAVWFGSFYALASCGFDIVPFLEKWNISDRIIAPFRSGGLGDLALAYLMYKLATPARYTVTIGGTNLAIRYLRKEGKIPIVAKEDSMRSLIREGKEDIKRISNARIKRLRRRNKKT